MIEAGAFAGVNHFFRMIEAGAFAGVNDIFRMIEAGAFAGIHDVQIEIRRYESPDSLILNHE